MQVICLFCEVPFLSNFQRCLASLLMISKFAGDTSLCGAVNRLEGRDAIQWNLDRFERWVHVNVLGLRGGPMWTSWSSSWLGQFQAQIQAGCRMDWEQHWGEGLGHVCGWEAWHDHEVCVTKSESQPHPELHQKQHDQQVEGSNSASLLWWNPQMEFSCIHLCRPQHKDVDVLEWVQRRAMEMVRGLEHLSYVERLILLGFFSLGMGRLWGDLIAPFGTYWRPAKKPERDLLRGQVVIEWGGTVLNRKRVDLG